MKSSLLVAVALTCGTLAVNANANLLTNGSFESPYSASPYTYYNAGSTAITGWTVVGGQIQHTNASSSLPASNGVQWLDLTGITGYNKGVISDAVSTVIGARYTLSFDLGDYYQAGFRNATLSVSINGAVPVLFTNEYTAGVMDWKTQTLDWIADSTTASIRFLGVANGALSNDYGIGLDNVDFDLAPAAVPIPGGLWLLGSGLLGLVAVARRRQV